MTAYFCLPFPSLWDIVVMYFTSVYVTYCPMPCYYFSHKQLYFKDTVKIKGRVISVYLHTSHFQCPSFLCLDPDCSLISFSFCMKDFLYSFLYCAYITFLVLCLCYWWILSAFVCLKKSLFLAFERYFHWVSNYFFWGFMVFWLVLFLIRSTLSFLSFPLNLMYLSLAAFKVFSY